MASTPNDREQVIAPDSLYTLDEAMARSGLGKGAFRKARNNGLKVQYYSTRGFVLGRDLIDFICSRSKREHH
jgi:hypothetical protein